MQKVRLCNKGGPQRSSIVGDTFLTGYDLSNHIMKLGVLTSNTVLKRQCPFTQT
ncbi:hypothetical protein [Paenibacillus polymyxa]|uniref:hypothetical protein n=1 Tax=Paenibacillus polymyxa TaxID=1406 RepID=UPI0032B00AA1